MRKFTALCRVGRALAHDRRGNFGMMMAVTAPLLLLAAGYGLNLAQMSLVRSNLLAALDSAVTSTARDLTTGVIAEKDARSVLEAFLFTNGTGAFGDPQTLSLDQIVIDKVTSTVRAQASVALDVAFPLFGMSNRQTITSESAAVYSDKKIEVAMMLDVTGSMERKGKDDKLGDLQRAATNAVNLLLKNQNAANPRVRVALVPYANSVNVGSSIARQAVYVERNASERKQAPASTDPKLVSGASRPDTCATERKGNDRYTNKGPEASMVNRDFLLDEFASGVFDGRRVYNSSLKCPAAEIVPLTANARTLTDMIGRFVADGGTGGHIGVQWAWYMLSESWKNVLPAASQPAKADPAKVVKYAILMTDGEFNLGYDGASRVQDVYGDAAAARSIPHAKKLCEEMRRDGIVIFTIGFKLESAAARDVMRSCASPETGSTRHYFDTADGAQLDAAFVEIARNIERLALIR